jgi:hypothetical protein
MMTLNPIVYDLWAKKEVSGVGKEGDEELADLICRIQGQHHYRYGSPLVREVLWRDYGKQITGKKEVRVMG